MRSNFLTSAEIACTLAVVLLSMASSSAAARLIRAGEARGQQQQQQPCAEMSSIQVAGLALPLCKEFHYGPEAIVLHDTRTIKFGAVQAFGSENCFFIDRNGTQTAFSYSLLPAFLRDDYHSGSESMSQMVFKATYGNATTTVKGKKMPKIVKVEIELLVDQAAMMLPFRGMSFIGSVINSAPLPEGIQDTYWFRWDLGSNISSFERTAGEASSDVWALDGTFVNLYDGVLETSPLPGTADVCRPGLVQDNATADWFEFAVGNGTDMHFYWYPDMHGPLDSEFVPVFSNHVSYMTSVPNPATLLASNVDVSKEYAFVIHGTPVGVLQYFKGTFSRQPPPVGCALNIN